MGELLLMRAAIASVFVYATLQWTFLKYFRKKVRSFSYIVVPLFVLPHRIDG